MKVFLSSVHLNSLTLGFYAQYQHQRKILFSSFTRREWKNLLTLEGLWEEKNQMQLFSFS